MLSNPDGSSTFDQIVDVMAVLSNPDGSSTFDQIVEMAGVEPASKNGQTHASTGIVRFLES